MPYWHSNCSERKTDGMAFWFCGMTQYIYISHIFQMHEHKHICGLFVALYLFASSIEIVGKTFIYLYIYIYEDMYITLFI